MSLRHSRGGEAKVVPRSALSDRTPSGSQEEEFLENGDFIRNQGRLNSPSSFINSATSSLCAAPGSGELFALYAACVPLSRSSSPSVTTPSACIAACPVS